MPKEAEAFRTISEVADDLGIPKHVLRFWEVKFTHIRPMKRGGGRRFYRPEDMELLRGIRHLLHREGYTIKGVQKILKEQGVESVKVHGKGEDTPAPVASPTPSPSSTARGRAAAPSSSPSGQSRATGRQELIRKAIADLDACRVMLGGRPREALKSVPVSPRRLVSGS